MTGKKVIKVEGTSTIGPFSPALQAGDFIFVSGQIAKDPETGEVVGDTIEEQTEQTLKNVKELLEAAGADLEDVVKCIVFLSDIDEWSRMNEVYARHFSEPYPARTAVEASLASPEFKLELTAIAYKEQ